MQGRIRSLASDTMLYGVFTIIGRFLTFLLTPLYTNYLTKTENGEITNIFAIIAFIDIIYNSGMESSFFRFFDKDDLTKSKKAFSNSFLAIALTGIIFTILLYLNLGYVTNYFSDLTNAKLIVLLAIIIPLTDSLIVIPYGLLRMTHRVKRFATTRFILVMIAIVLNIVFVVFCRYGALGVVLAQVITNVISIFFFFPEVRKYLIIKIDKIVLSDMVKFGIPTIPAAMSAMILQIADRILVKSIGGAEMNGIYSINYKLGIPMMLLVSMFEYAWKPFYLNHYQDKDAKQLFSRILTYFTIAAAGFFLITGFFMNFIIRLPFVGGRFINPEYWSGLGIIPLILGGYFFNGLFINFSNAFYITKKTKYFPIAVGTAAIVNIVMNIVTIPIWGYYGAAVADIVAYFISAVILYIYAHKIYPINYDWKRVFFIIILTVIIYLIGMKITANMTLLISFIIRVVLFISIGVIMYFFKFFKKEELTAIKGLLKRS